MSTFVHLSCHTEYSLLEGALRIPRLLNEVKEMGVSAVAITDNGSMYGAIEFYLKARELGINPIIGCEVFLTPDISVKERARDRVLLLCKDFYGYQNLVKCVSKSHLDGFYYKPRIDLEHLQNFSQGIIAISSGYHGPIAQAISKHQTEDALHSAKTLHAIFGDDFYIGLQKCGLPF